ncbi:MAG: hypothetical protein R2704_16455 [Microthrixaceae bacterium]
MVSSFDVRPLTASRRRTLEWIVLALALWRVLAVRWTPIVTEDSLGYLERARSPLSTGFVVDGYRQIGYPLWLWFVEHTTAPLGFDRLFAGSSSPSGCCWCWRRSRCGGYFGCGRRPLWFVTSAGMVVTSNFVLNEGVLFSLAMLAAAAVLGAATTVAPLTGVRPPARPGRWLVVAMAVVSVATVLKLQYVLLGLPIVPTLWALQPRGLRMKPVLAAGGAMALLLTVMVVGQTLENSREYHDPTPVSEQAHAQWWGAYRTVFHTDPETAELSGVQRFRGDGFESFYFPLIDSEPDYRVRRELAERQIDDLFAAAGTSRAREHWKAFRGGLAGGRHDDLSFYLPPVFSGPPETGLTINSAARDLGTDALLDEVNDGRTPGDLTPGGVVTVVQRVGADQRWLYPGLAVLSLLIAALGWTLGGRERWIGPAAALGHVLSVALLATGFIDIQRYLAPYVVASTCVGLWAIAAAAHRASVGRNDERPPAACADARPEPAAASVERR